MTQQEIDAINHAKISLILYGKAIADQLASPVNSTMREFANARYLMIERANFYFEPITNAPTYRQFDKKRKRK